MNMMLRNLIFVLAAMAVCETMVGCSSDAPTQGTPVSKQQLVQDIDKSLDEAAALPEQMRGIAIKKLERPVASKGTPAQKARYAELMKGVQPIRFTPAARLRAPGN